MTSIKNHSAHIDLTNCESEPIHIPGMVQPHGIIWEIGLDLKVLRVSENVEDELGWTPEEVLGQNFYSFLDKEGWDFDLKEALEKKTDISKWNPLALHLKTKTGNKIPTEVITHSTPNGILIETEFHQDYDHHSGKTLSYSIMESLELFKKRYELQDLMDFMTEKLRELTGYDRIMVYRFDKHWNGEVLAESKRDSLLPYLGLHYPASDIPKQARALYEKNLLRIIPDVNYIPSVIRSLPEYESQEFDLSQSVLRSVSPMHVEYLQNMGVGATMTISIIRDGKLWGLIACHHSTPKYISNEMRAACLLLGQFFSNQLDLVIRLANREELVAFSLKKDRLLKQIQESDSLISGLLENQETLLDYVSADGVALIYEGRVEALGKVPEKEMIVEILRILLDQYNSLDCFSSHSLSGIHPNFRSIKNIASGVLIGAIPSKIPIYMIWFRREVVQTIKWSGDPHKPVTVHGENITRLHPRKSFDEWKESVKYHSLPWTENEKNAVYDLTTSISRFILRKAELISDLFQEISGAKYSKEEALKISEEKQDLLSELHHRVKNNLQIIVSLLSLQSSFVQNKEVLTALGDSQARISSLIMVHEILHKDESFNTASIYEYFNLIVNFLTELNRTKMSDIWIDIDCISDKLSTTELIPMGLILNELIMNSYRYAFPLSHTNSGKPKTIQISFTAETDSEYRFFYKDNGIGYPEGTPFQNPKSLGLLLIKNLSIQLKGKTVYSNQSGAVFELVFPKPRTPIR